MKKVTKVVMFVYKMTKNNPKFFALNRRRGDIVVLTGHIGDNIPGESIENAVKREIKEEIGIEPLEIFDLKCRATVKLLEKQIISTEHGFLVKIPADKYIRFLEHQEKHSWYFLDNLIKNLTYPHQKKFAKKIKNFIK